MITPVEAEQALRLALDQLGVAWHAPVGPHDAADLIIDLDGKSLPVEVKAYALIDGPRAAELIHHSPPSGKLALVVGERVVESARERLRAAGIGWLDLRGHLFLRAPGLFIDTETAPQAPPAAAPQPLAGRVGMATAVHLLLHPGSRPGVRESADALNVAASSVSVAFKALRAAGLMEDNGDVDHRALFWETASRWRPRWIGVARYPHPENALLNPALELGMQDLRGKGWSLSGDLAAAALDAPIGVGSRAVPDFYLPSDRALRLAVSILGESVDVPEARLATAPVAAACASRVDATPWADEHWPCARALFVALDLAQDPGRGREILDQWDKPRQGVRVW